LINSKPINQDIFFPETNEEETKKVSSKALRRYFDENKNFKMLVQRESLNDRYTSLKLRTVKMPNAVKDENQRYYSPSKYFTIDVEKENSLTNMSKSFDQFDPPKSKKRKILYTKLIPQSVTRMKHLMKQRCMHSKLI